MGTNQIEILKEVAGIKKTREVAEKTGMTRRIGAWE
jgi:hypothetical protein